ncbi:MAG: hypothetical protein VKJ05_05810 [Synechococcaceae cyanobacterium]|nr:hypothetical protein [Synechococcaceae cyanobacterium]
MEIKGKPTEANDHGTHQQKADHKEGDHVCLAAQPLFERCEAVGQAKQKWRLFHGTMPH